MSLETEILDQEISQKVLKNLSKSSEKLNQLDSEKSFWLQKMDDQSQKI